jgi:hypothetical protein
MKAMQIRIRKYASLVGFVVAILISGVAMADESCEGAVSDWQSRDVLRQQVEQHGWTIKRIKIDDGCYEVRGFDGKGNRFKAIYAPVTLKIQAFEIRFGKNGESTGYFLPGQQAK